MKHFYFIGGLMVAFLSSSTMQADTLSIKVIETGFTSLSASGSGTASIANESIGDFTVESVVGTGSPIFSEPYLDLQDLDITKLSDNTTATLTIELTETGLTQRSPMPVISSFTGNLDGLSSEIISSYYDPSNTAYGTTDMLGTATFTASGSNASPNEFDTITSPGTFSETEIIVANFDDPTDGRESLNSSALILSDAPEPFSMGIVGAGLLGVSLIGIRRRKKSSN